MSARIGFDLSALDPSFKSHLGRGIGRYVGELKNQFDKIDPDNSNIGYFSHQNLNAGILGRLINLVPLGKTTLRQQFMYPIKFSGLGYDILHFPAHMDAPAWGMSRYILTVLDLIPLIFKDLYTIGRSNLRFKFARWLEIQAIKNATHIIAISETTKRDVINILGIPPSRISVTHLGVDPSFFQKTSLNIQDLKLKLGIPPQKDFFLYVGGIDQRKNLNTLLEVYAESRKFFETTPPVLVIAGKIQKDPSYPKLLDIVKKLGIATEVYMVGYVSDDELKILYSECLAFLFLSLYEGFGLTPLEAMAAGAPVISSNLSCMPEVLGSAAIFIDPSDLKQCIDKTLEVAKNPALRQKLKEDGIKQASKFTWEATAKQTIEVYNKVAFT